MHHFTLTLYAKQPNVNTRDPFSGNPITGVDVGHTFVSMATNFGGLDKNITFGFYPSSTVDLNIRIAPMETVDDSNKPYDSSVEIQLTCDDFNTALNNSIISSANTNYDLNNYNCTDFGISVANSVGLGVTDTSSPWVYLGKVYGNSSNPGDLGEDIKLIPNGIANNGTLNKTYRFPTHTLSSNLLINS